MGLKRQYIDHFYLGAVGFVALFAARGIAVTPSDIFYYLIKLYGWSMPSILSPYPIELDIARYLAPMATGFAGVRVALEVFRDRLQLLRVHLIRHFTVIVGLNDRGLNLVKNFRATTTPVVVLEVDAKNENILAAKAAGAFVIIGNATDKQVLQKVRVHRAKYLLAVTVDDDVNVCVATKACEIASGINRKTKSSLECFAHVSDLQLMNSLQQVKVGSFQACANTIPVRYFNEQKNAARLLLHQYPLDMSTDTINPDAPPVHLLLVGFDSMGLVLVLHAARMAAFVNQKPLHITVIDTDAKKKQVQFESRYPEFHLACTVHFVEAETSGLSLLYSNLWNKEGKLPVTMAVVCPSNDAEGLARAVDLHQQLNVENSNQNAIPILVHMPHGDGMHGLAKVVFGPGSLLSSARPNIHPFGLVDEICSKEIVIHDTMRQIARVSHEEYVAASLAMGQAIGSRPAVNHWEDLPEYYKVSNLRQVDHIPLKIRAVGCNIRTISKDSTPGKFAFTPQEIELLAQMEHKRWMIERYLDGWSQGADNPNRKTTLYLIPYEDLSEEIKQRDRNIVNNIPSYREKTRDGAGIHPFIP